jgi:hypothetical protein
MNKLQKQLEKLAGEKATLQRERTDLQRQTSELSAAVDKLNRDKVRHHSAAFMSLFSMRDAFCATALVLLWLLLIGQQSCCLRLQQLWGLPCRPLATACADGLAAEPHLGVARCSSPDVASQLLSTLPYAVQLQKFSLTACM